MTDYHRSNFGLLMDRTSGLAVGYIDDTGAERLYSDTFAMPAPQGTLAERNAASALLAIPRQRFITTDTALINGAVNPMGTEWISDGTQWRPRMPQTVVLDISVATGTQTTPEQVIKTITLPAGLLHLQRFQIEVATGKTGLTDILQQFNLRLGTAGSVADALVGATATTLLAVGNRCLGFTTQFEAVDATTLVRRGTGGGLNLGSFDGNPSSTAMGVAVTVPNMLTNPLKLSFTSSMVTALSDRPQVGDVRLTILP